MARYRIKMNKASSYGSTVGFIGASLGMMAFASALLAIFPYNQDPPPYLNLIMLLLLCGHLTFLLMGIWAFLNYYVDVDLDKRLVSIPFLGVLRKSMNLPDVITSARLEDDPEFKAGHILVLTLKNGGTTVLKVRDMSFLLDPLVREKLAQSPA